MSPVPNTFFDQKMSKIIESASFLGFWSPENTMTKAVLNLWLKHSVCLCFTPITWLCLKTKLFELYYLYTLKTEICFQKNLFPQARRLLCPADKGEAGTVRRGARCPSVVVISIYARKMKGRKRQVYTDRPLFVCNKCPASCAWSWYRQQAYVEWEDFSLCVFLCPLNF